MGEKMEVEAKVLKAKALCTFDLDDQAQAVATTGIYDLTIQLKIGNTYFKPFGVRAKVEDESAVPFAIVLEEEK